MDTAAPEQASELDDLRGQREALQGRVEALQKELAPLRRAVAAYHAMMSHTSLMLPCCRDGVSSCERALELGQTMMDLMKVVGTNRTFTTFTQ